MYHPVRRVLNASTILVGPLLRNWNRRTLTVCLSGTGTVIKWYHKRGDDKFLGNNAAAIDIKKARFFTTNFFKLLFYGLGPYGAGTGTVTCQKSEPEP
jgi:hypothetical protein